MRIFQKYWGREFFQNYGRSRNFFSILFRGGGARSFFPNFWVPFEGGGHEIFTEILGGHEIFFLKFLKSSYPLPPIRNVPPPFFMKPSFSFRSHERLTMIMKGHEGVIFTRAAGGLCCIHHLNVFHRKSKHNT